MIEALMLNHGTLISTERFMEKIRCVEETVIGVIKEALSNTAKHSNGDSIKIIIREHPALYQLSIADNGSCLLYTSSSSTIRYYHSDSRSKI